MVSKQVTACDDHVTPLIVYRRVYQWMQTGSSSQYIYSGDALYKVEPGVIVLSSSTLSHAVGAQVCKLSLNVHIMYGAHTYINK